MSFNCLAYHFVFSTYNRKMTIPEDGENDLYRYIWSLAKKLGAFVYRIGGMGNHVHLLCQLPPTLAPSEFMRIIKQESSRVARTLPTFRHWEGWGDGYGGFTVSPSEIEHVINYIKNQKQHHKVTSFRDEYRAWLIENGISPDVPYFPK